MERNDFLGRLELAARFAVEFARTLVTNDLADAVEYVLLPNQSHDKNLQEGEVVFPADSLDVGASHGPWKSISVVDFLWRNGCVPEWVDASVLRSTASTTIIQLLCCGRYTSDSRLLYYPDRSTSPFAVKSPVLPMGWREGDKFTIG